MSQNSFRVEAERPNGSVTRLRLQGRLVGPEAGRRLVDSANGLGSDTQPLVLDFDQLEFMDCAGIGSLVQVACAAREAGRPLKLTGMNSRVRELMNTVGCFDALKSRGSAATSGKSDAP